MLNPITAAKNEKKFESFDSLAKELCEKFPGLEWPAPRSLGAKIGDLDRGKDTWWLRRPAQAEALAKHLELSAADLGLHLDTGRSLFEFKEFPALPPLDLSHESPCEIGKPKPFTDRKDFSEADLDQWLGRRPHGAQRSPTGITWINFPKGSGRDMFWAFLEARTPYDHLRVASLAGVADRIKQPRPIAVHIENNEGYEDLAVLMDKHADASVMVVASFPPETRTDAALDELWENWEFVTASNKDRQRLLLTNPNNMLYFTDSNFHIRRYEWTLNEDWQEMLAAWVEERLNAGQSDTLFSATGLRKWLNNFPFLNSSIKTPGDFLAICRACHQTPERALPHRSDQDAGRKLLKYSLRAKPALERPFVQLTEHRWNSESVSWKGPLGLDQWRMLAPKDRYAPTENELLTIAEGTNKEARREKAKEVSTRCVGGASLQALWDANFLVENSKGELDLTPGFLVDLLARDYLIEKIKTGPVETWAKLCFDPERRSIVDSALEALSTDELIPVAERVYQLPTNDTACIAASEALFIAAARRIGHTWTLPPQLQSLPKLVIRRLTFRSEYFTSLLTRPSGLGDEDRIEWITCCWLWSLTKKPEQFKIPESSHWLFPGWFDRLPESSSFIAVLDWRETTETQMGTWEAIHPNHRDRILTCTAELVRRQKEPVGNPPQFMKPFLLVEGAKGKLEIDPLWWDGVVERKWAEDALLNLVKPLGSVAATKLWPSLLGYQILLNHGKVSDKAVYFPWRSPVWIWILKNISIDDAIALPSDEQMLQLQSAPRRLPPEMRVRLIERLPKNDDDAFKTVKRIVESCDKGTIQLLIKLLGTEYGSIVAKRLWELVPNEAKSLLAGNEGLSSSALADLVHLCPDERLAAAVSVLQSRDGIMDTETLRSWAMTRLPRSGQLAPNLIGLMQLSGSKPGAKPAIRK